LLQVIIVKAINLQRHPLQHSLLRENSPEKYEEPAVAYLFVKAFWSASFDERRDDSILSKADVLSRQL
jgi:hypothetical protein